MNGHQDIIKLRTEGFKPAWVYLNDFLCQTDWYKSGLPATVCVAGEAAGSLDMRFLVGLCVVVNALSEKRAKELLKASQDAGAEFVVVVDLQPEQYGANYTGFHATWWKPLPVSGVKHG